MRLLFLNHNYRFGGTYYRAMGMAEQLALRGHQVTLLTVSREHKWRAEWSTVNGVRVGEMPHLNQSNSGEGYGPIDISRRLWNALLHHYDIIQMFDHKPNATFAGFAGRLRGAALIADWSDWWGGPGGINDVPRRRIPAVGKFEEWWEVRSKQWADAVVTISTVLYERGLALGCPRERILYLPTGAPVHRIRPIPVAEARAKLNVPLDRKIVGFIGIGQGDLEIVMRAMQQLEDVWLMVIGPETVRVRDLAQSMGVGHRLWQTGLVTGDPVTDYLGCADVLCLPMTDTAANRGRLPNKLLDYMAAGRPIVASPIGDVRTILEKHDAGLLAEAPEYAAVFTRLFSDQRLREQLGRSARYAAETAFAWPHLIDDLEAFYAQVMNRFASGKSPRGEEQMRVKNHSE